MGDEGSRPGMYYLCLVAALKDYTTGRGLDTKPLLCMHQDGSTLNRVCQVQWCRWYWPKRLYKAVFIVVIRSFCIICSFPQQLRKSIEWFLWTIEPTNSSLDNSKKCFAHHGMPDEARDGWNVALNYQVNCWCAWLSKGTILYYQLSMTNNFHNS